MTQGGDRDRLRILFVTSMHPSAGSSFRGLIIRRYADAIRMMGHEVRFAEIGTVGGPWRYLLARQRVRDAIDVTQPDVVHVHFGYSGLAVPHTCIPVVSTFYGDDLNGTAQPSGRLTLKSRLGIAISQYVAWRSVRCITVSTPLRSRLWTRSLQLRTRVIRDAVDPTLFRPLPRAEARVRLGISPEDVLVMFPHAADVPTKRVWLAEAAVACLRKTISGARLWIVNGRQPDEMPWYYAAADVMIVTSLLEGGPSSVKEALACGLPVVSVRVGDTALFEEVPEGILCADPDSAGLASVLLRVLQRSVEERKSYLPSGLSIREAANAIVGVYRQALAQS